MTIATPLWGQAKACNNAVYAGPHDLHFFWGSLSSSPIFLDRHGAVRLVGDNHRRLREIRQIYRSYALDPIFGQTIPHIVVTHETC